jgi:ATP-binding cassette subfamily B protein
MPEPEEPEPGKKSVDRTTVRRVLGLFRPHMGMVAKTGIAVLVGVVLGLLPPYFLQIIIDEGIQKRRMEVVGLYSFLTIVAVLAGAGVTLLYGYWSVVMGQRIMCDLRSNLYRNLQRMSLRFFTATRTGDIQTRLISDVGGVQSVVSNTFTDQISNVAIVITTLIAMFVMDWRLTLLSLAVVPLVGIFGKFVGDFAREVRKGTQEQLSEFNSLMQETLSVSGALLTKTTGRLDVVLEKFDRENALLAKWQIKSAVVTYLFFGLIRMITQLAPVLVYWLAGWLLIRQGDASITVGKLVAFSGLQIRLFFPLSGLSSAQVEIMSSFALFERIFEYLDLKPDVKLAENAPVLDKREVKGRIEFQNVSFEYEPGVRTIRNVSFTAEPGQLVALVGPSGAGKTTLTYLIPRLYDVDEGRVLLDGQDIREVDLQSLTALIATVTQETYLLHSTIRENLRVAKPDATNEEMEQACKLAAIHDHILTLEHGYDTVVGERGYRLSGGEKQRLAIARAVLKDAKILILDEATSALDTTSERLIQRSLQQLMRGRTTFAIAHRLSTILAADLILVLQKGEIVERGRHEELLEKGGLYAKLYHEQFESPSMDLAQA